MKHFDPEDLESQSIVVMLGATRMKMESLQMVANVS